MALNIDALTNALVKAYTEKKTVTSIDAQTGVSTKKVETFSPPKDKMKKLATEIINHIKDSAEVYQVSTNVNTTVSTTVAPGIPLVSPAGPGSTTGPGAGTGSGTGTGAQTGTGKVK